MHERLGHCCVAFLIGQPDGCRVNVAATSFAHLIIRRQQNKGERITFLI